MAIMNYALCIKLNHLPASPYSSYPLRGRRRVRLTRENYELCIMHYELTPLPEGLNEA